MKETVSLKNQLGLLQEEMAMVLQVNPSQWSMYKSGKRSLPLPATKQLASILLHLQSGKTASPERKEYSLLEQRKAQEWLKQELQTIAHQKQLLDRKKQVIENKRAECFAALEVVRFLETQPETIPVAPFKEIKTRVLDLLDKNSLVKLQQLEMKVEQLAAWEKGLMKRMQV